MSTRLLSELKHRFPDLVETGRCVGLLGEGTTDLSIDVRVERFLEEEAVAGRKKEAIFAINSWLGSLGISLWYTSEMTNERKIPLGWARGNVYRVPKVPCNSHVYKFVLDNSKAHILSVLRECGVSPIKTVTDSFVIESNEVPPQLQLSDKMGEWKLEAIYLEDITIDVKGVVSGPCAVLT